MSIASREPSGGPLRSWLLALARSLADLVCPERCAACEVVVGAATIFCHGCRAHVNVLASPVRASRHASAATAGAAPDLSVRHARAWALYRVPGVEQPVARALAALKYGNRTRLARRMALAMAARVPDPTVSLVVPVPLHPRRLRARGYNQSALLARHLARALGRPVAPHLVARVRDTPSQTTASVQARAANVAGAFVVRRVAAVRGRRVLLVDDVWTSGATARAVAAALRTAGARSVDVVTFARVPPP